MKYYDKVKDDTWIDLSFLVPPHHLVHWLLMVTDGSVASSTLYSALRLWQNSNSSRIQSPLSSPRGPQCPVASDV